MTPTLWGRIQTRLFLMLTIGLFITFFFMWWWDDSTPFIILMAATIIGIAWDAIYIFIQRYRWDRDFPFSFQFMAGIVEGIFLYLLIGMEFLPFVELGKFIQHYGAVFLCTYMMLLGPIVMRRKSVSF